MNSDGDGDDGDGGGGREVIKVLHKYCFKGPPAMHQERKPISLSIQFIIIGTQGNLAPERNEKKRKNV